ncbi:TetR family transcriptional regulator [Conexibacter sp. W3-3-2]|nr:TetR family transcriptional regulator [Conexibacter sp. W3-3-2]
MWERGVGVESGRNCLRGTYCHIGGICFARRYDRGMATGSRPSVRERNRERVRDEIGSAARRLFLRQGYAATTIEEVAEEAGVSPAPSTGSSPARRTSPSTATRRSPAASPSCSTRTTASGTPSTSSPTPSGARSTSSSRPPDPPTPTPGRSSSCSRASPSCAATRRRSWARTTRPSGASWTAASAPPGTPRPRSAPRSSRAPSSGR